MLSDRASRNKFSIRILSLFLLIAIAALVGSAYLYQSETLHRQAQQTMRAQESVRAGATSIKNSLADIGSDLTSLANRLEAKRLQSGEELSRLTHGFLESSDILKTRLAYDSIRLFDASGNERARIDYSQASSVRIASRERHDNGDRHIFEAAMKLRAGEWFASPLELNTVNGHVEVPYKPTIRFAMPLFDGQGTRCGVIVVNYSAQALLQHFAEEIAGASEATWLLNRDGFWLKGSIATDEFGFMLGRSNLTMAQRYPFAWQKIAQRDSGQFVAPEGLWSFATVRPLPSEEGSTHLKTFANAYSWKVVSLLPASEYGTGSMSFRVLLALGTTLTLLTMLAILWRMKQAENTAEMARRSLLQREAQLQGLMHILPDLVWMKNQDGVYQVCNAAFERFMGIKQEHIIGKTDQDLIDSVHAQIFRTSDQIAISAGKAVTHEEWITVVPYGQHALLETTKAPISSRDGELLGVLGIARNITERNRIENELRKHQYLLTNLSTHLPSVIYQFRMDVNGNMSFPFVSEAIQQLLGISPGMIYQDAALMFSAVHPEDYPVVLDSILDSAKQLRTWRREFRIIHPADGTHWVMGHSVPEKQADNSIIWYGILSDITERKLTEGGVQLASMVYQNSTEAIVITNTANDIIAVNPAFEQITGYSPEEVIGQNPRILKSGRHEQAFYEAMWNELHQHGAWQGEIWNQRKDGSIFPSWLTINVAYREDKTVHYYIATSSDITKLKESEKLIWKQANFDTLTGLPNRNMFREHVELAFKKSMRSGLPVSLILLDLDDFKDVNDTLGHDMGDLLLQEVSERLRNCVRETDVVARLGGDEFAVTLCEIPEHAIVERIAQEILRTISDPYLIKGEQLHISASVGITFYPKDGTEIETLVKNADQAMYTAKRMGRNRSHFFDPSMQETAQARMRIVNELRAVLDGSQFVLHYQPIIELATGDIQRAEALLRWQHPERGMINPAGFIKIAEETGMIDEIGSWVFREATKQVGYWKNMHHPDFQISINMSPMQFRKDDMPGGSWAEHLKKMSLPGQSIVVEITEGLLLDASPSVYKHLLNMRQAGIEIAIDDFGTGYSSLAYLKRFDIDYLKIDRSFVSNLSHESEDLALCEAIIAMAHTLGMKVIAEGIETEMQCALLKQAGCDFGQGHYFAPPMPAAGLDTLLQPQHKTSRTFSYQ